MARACKIRPTVKSADGRKVDSILFDELFHWTGYDRNQVKALWGLSRTDAFKSERSSRLQKDVNGEPTARSLIEDGGLYRDLSPKNIAEGLNWSMRNEITKDRTAASVHKLMEIIEQHSKTPMSEIAVPRLEVADDSVSLRFVPSDGDSRSVYADVAEANSLHASLSKWLERHGIAIGELTEAEASQGIDGITDFRSGQRTADGLAVLIRIAKGEKGLGALTEEAAHIAIRALKGKDKSVDRVLAMLENDESLVREAIGVEYDKYAREYKGDKQQLAEEAAGKLLKSQLEDAYENRKLKRHRSILERMTDAILAFFRRFDQSELTRLREAARGLRVTAENILDDDCYEPFDLEEMSRGAAKLYALSDEYSQKLANYVQKLAMSADVENRKLRRKGGKAAKRAYRKKELMATLLNNRDKGEFVAGIANFMNSMHEDVGIQLKKWKNGYSGNMSNELKARICNDAINLQKTYSQILTDYYDLLDEIENDPNADPALLAGMQGLKDLCDESRSMLDKMAYDARRKAMPAFIEFAQRFCDTVVTVPFGKAYGKSAGEEVSLSETMTKEAKDISFFDMWLVSGAMSSSFNIQSLAKIINMLQLQVRDEAMTYNKRLKDLTIRLEEAGISNQDFMYERDENGELTGRFIKADSKAYEALDSVRKKYYNDVMSIKAELDRFLPPFVTDLINAPKVRKDIWEVLKATRGSKAKVLKDKMSEMWSLKSDDEYTLKNDTLLFDYSGERIDMIPLRFLAFGKDENMNNMSTDIVESMSLYAQMALNYGIMNEALPNLQNALDIIENGSFGTEEEIDVSGRKFVVDKHKTSRVGSNEVTRIKALYDSQLYGMKVYDTRVGGIDITKLGHNLMQWTALNQYAMNPHGALQNEITGLIVGAVESMGGNHFGKSDLAWAHGVYLRNLPDLTMDFGKRIKNSKISLFNERLNIMQESDREQNFNRKTRLGRLVDSQLPYIMTGAGEHNLHTLTGLAMAHRTKLKDIDGNVVNLWDALETISLKESMDRKLNMALRNGDVAEEKRLRVLIDAHPEWADGKTKVLELRQGLYTMDGAVANDQWLHEEVRRIMAVNHRLHGIYNEEDKSMMQQYVIGQMMIMYRKWMTPSYMNRFMTLRYSQDTKEWEEGYYMTLGRCITEFVVGCYNTKSLNKKELTEFEKTNIKKAIFEIGLWTLMLGLKSVLSGLKKKRRREYSFHVLNYFVVRTASELSAYVPFGIPRETLRLLQSPSAVLSSANGFLNFLYTAASFRNYEWYAGEDALLKSGPYKGQSRVESAFWKSGIPLGYHQLDGLMHLDEKVKFYE